MSNLVHINMMRQMLKSGNVCSLKHWKDDGSIVVANRVISTSSYHHGNTFKIKFLDSGSFRNVRAITIFEINDMEVFI
jgi:hypothetical protein